MLLVTQSKWGGAQRYVFDLATNLTQDFEVTVGCGGGGELVDKIRDLKLKIIVFDNLVREINPIKDFICFWQLYNFIRKEKFDIVHTNSSKAEILGNLAAKLAGVKKILFTAHGYVFNEPMSDLKRKIYIRLERFANKFTSKTICVSEFDRQGAIKNKIAPEDKFVVINNGIADAIITNDQAPITKQIQNSNNQIQNKVLIGTVANLYKTKGLEYLIEAARILNQEFDNLEFVVIGSGPEKDNLTKLISDSQFPVSNFQFLGFKENAVQYLKNFDIFVLPSVKEGFPYTILEAMSAGLPIVATKVGGIPEIITPDENGLLCEPKNAEELAYNLKKLILNPGLWQKIGENNKIKVAKEFSLNQMLDKTIIIYNS